MQGHVQAKLLLDDCYQDIDADGDPNLRPHSVLGSAVEAFVEGASLDKQQVQHIDVVHLAVRDVDEGGNRSPQIEQRVQLDGRLGGAKRRPREHRQAQIDGRSIEGIHGIGQFYTEVLVDVERAGLDDKPLSQLEVDAPVARFVGIGQRRASDRRADAHVVKLAGLSRQTHFDIAQAFAVGQLREGHDAKLLGATEAARPVIAAVTIDDAMEGLPRKEVHDLREQGLAEVHGDSGVEKPGTLAQTAISDSSRRHPLSSEKPYRYWLSRQYLSS